MSHNILCICNQLNVHVSQCQFEITFYQKFKLKEKKKKEGKRKGGNTIQASRKRERERVSNIRVKNIRHTTIHQDRLCLSQPSPYRSVATFLYDVTYCSSTLNDAVQSRGRRLIYRGWDRESRGQYGEKLQIHRCSAYPADKSRVKPGQVEKESNLHFVFPVSSLLAATRDEFPSLPGKSIGNIAGLSLSNNKRRSSFSTRLLAFQRNSYIVTSMRLEIGFLIISMIAKDVLTI